VSVSASIQITRRQLTFGSAGLASLAGKAPFDVGVVGAGVFGAWIA